MRVWLVNQYATPAAHSGGTRHYSLARALRPQGIEVEIFCSTRNYLTGAVIADPLPFIGPKAALRRGLFLCALPVPPDAFLTDLHG